MKKLGAQDVTTRKLGAQNVSRRYLGATLVWEAGAASPIITAPTLAASDSLSGRTLTIAVDSTTGNPAPTTALTALTLDGSNVLGDETGTGPWAYEVPDSADGQTIAWTVEASNAEGSETASGSGVIPANLFAPSPATAPSISGTVEPGETVTLDAGTYTGTEPITITFALTLDGVDVTGDVVSGGYTIPPGAVGQSLVYSETASNGIAPDAAQSVSETVQGIAPTLAASDSLSGRTLTITVDSTTGVPAPVTALTALTLDGVDVLGDATGSDPWTYEVPDSATGKTVAWTLQASNYIDTVTVSGSETVPSYSYRTEQINP